MNLARALTVGEVATKARSETQIVAVFDGVCASISLVEQYLRTSRTHSLCRNLNVLATFPTRFICTVPEAFHLSWSTVGTGLVNKIAYSVRGEYTRKAFVLVILQIILFFTFPSDNAIPKSGNLFRMTPSPNVYNHARCSEGNWG